MRVWYCLAFSDRAGIGAHVSEQLHMHPLSASLMLFGYGSVGFQPREIAVATCGKTLHQPITVI